MFAATAATGAVAVVTPWNPHVAFAWFPVFLVLCLSSVRNRPTDLAPASLIGSALIQLHISYLVLAAVPLLVAVGILIFDNHQRLHRSAVRRFLGQRRVVSWVALAFAIWIPPVVEQLVHGTNGNLARIARFFQHPPTEVGGPAGVRFAERFLGDQSGSLCPAWGKGRSHRTIQRMDQARFDVATHPAHPAARRPRSSPHGRNIATNICDLWLSFRAALGSGFVALALVVGERWQYLFEWRFILVWFAISVSIATIVDSMRTRRASEPSDNDHRNGQVALAIAVCVSALFTTIRITSWPAGRILPLEKETEQLSEDVLKTPRPNETVTIVRFGSILLGVGDGVLNATDRAGWRVGVLPGLGFKYGQHRVHNPSDDPTKWLVTETSVDTTIAELVPDSRVLARTTPLGRDAERKIVRAQAQVLRELVRNDRLDLVPAVGSSLIGFALAGAGVFVEQPTVDRLTKLNQKVEESGTCRCAVVAVPTQTAENPNDTLRKIMS